MTWHCSQDNSLCTALQLYIAQIFPVKTAIYISWTYPDVSISVWLNCLDCLVFIFFVLLPSWAADLNIISNKHIKFTDQQRMYSQYKAFLYTSWGKWVNESNKAQSNNAIIVSGREICICCWGHPYLKLKFIFQAMDMLVSHLWIDFWSMQACTIQIIRLFLYY